MQLSASSVSLDQSLAGFPAAGTSVPGPPPTADATPGAFSALLFMQGQPGSAATATVPGADSALIAPRGLSEPAGDETATADDEATPADGVSAWLLADGFGPIPATTSSGERIAAPEFFAPPIAAEPHDEVSPTIDENAAFPQNRDARDGAFPVSGNSMRTSAASPEKLTPPPIPKPASDSRLPAEAAVEVNAGLPEPLAPGQPSVSGERSFGPPVTATTAQPGANSSEFVPAVSALRSQPPQMRNSTALSSTAANPTAGALPQLDSDAAAPSVSDPRAMTAREPAIAQQAAFAAAASRLAPEANRTMRSNEPAPASEPIAEGGLFADEDTGATRAFGNLAVVSLPKPQFQAESDFPIQPQWSGAKFAVRPTDENRASSGEGENTKKDSLVSEDELVADTSSSLGINAAKTESLMPPFATLSASVPASTARDVTVSPVQTFDSMLPESGEAIPELTQAARRSIDSIMDVAQHFAADKRAVTLQFSVSGVDLGVRVELRNDGVHTTFRTDSPELRAALAQEWQSVTTGQPDRSSRFVDPVFTSNSSGGFTGQESGTMDQRGSHPRPEARFTEDLAALHRAPVDETAEASATPAERTVPSSTPGRLHTFA